MNQKECKKSNGVVWKVIACVARTGHSECDCQSARHQALHKNHNNVSSTSLLN
jgi:hypothetical protein